MTYWVYKDAQGYWRWYLEAANGKKIANSGEGYYNEADCLYAIGLVMDTNRNTPIRKR
jgi:uncharacterized protein